MITERELSQAINECENAPASYHNCEKLATFYTIQSHLRGAEPTVERLTESVVAYDSDTAFGEAISGQKSDEMWAVMDELMEALMVVNPRLYEGVLRKIRA